MKHSLQNFYRRFYRLIMGRINPVKYAKRIGVNFTPPYFSMVQWFGAPNHGLLHLGKMYILQMELNFSPTMGEL